MPHVLISVRGSALREELYQQKFSLTPSGIETATFWLVAPCPNQMHHRALRQQAAFVFTAYLRTNSDF
jgi:hypothetical protein